MSININGEEFTTFADYMNDETKVSKAEKAQVELETALFGKLIEEREAMGLAQGELAKPNRNMV